MSKNFRDQSKSCLGSPTHRRYNSATTWKRFKNWVWYAYFSLERVDWLARNNLPHRIITFLCLSMKFNWPTSNCIIQSRYMQQKATLGLCDFPEKILNVEWGKYRVVSVVYGETWFEHVQMCTLITYDIQYLEVQTIKQEKHFTFFLILKVTHLNQTSVNMTCSKCG